MKAARLSGSFGIGQVLASRGVGVAAALVLAAGAAGCIPGRGEACNRHSDCEAGLACGSDNKCDVCGDKVSCVAFDLVIRSCDAAYAPTTGATELQIRIEGEGLTPMTKTVNLAEPGIDLPEIPEGTRRRIYVDAVSGSEVIGRGASAYFDVSFANPAQAQVVWLRAKSKFSRTNSATDTDAPCSEMKVARAGHTATTLKDGRVLLVGGYQPESSKKTPINSVEMYDPRTGLFTLLEQKLNKARYGHVTTLLPDGRVLVTGGIDIINDKESSLKVAELFDPTSAESQQKGWKYFLMNTARSRHAATLLPDSGFVLISGGYAVPEDLYPVASTEVFDFRKEQPETVPGPDLATPRGGHASALIAGDQILLVGGSGPVQEAGGTTVPGPLKKSELVQLMPDNTFVVRNTDQFQLSDGRVYPAAVSLGTGANGVLVVGAPASGGTNPDVLWDWFPLVSDGTATARVIDALPTPRREACVATFDSQGGSGAIVVGGRSTGTSAMLNTADVYTLEPNDDSTPGAPPYKVRVKRTEGTLATVRARPACATLLDGSVLVTGGETTDGQFSVSSTYAEVFVP